MELTFKSIIQQKAHTQRGFEAILVVYTPNGETVGQLLCTLKTMADFEAIAVGAEIPLTINLAPAAVVVETSVVAEPLVKNEEKE